MPTGRVRATGGSGHGRLSCAVNLRSLRRFRLSRAPACRLVAARRDRQRLRDAIRFYLAVAEASVTSTEILAAERRFRTACGRLLRFPRDLEASTGFHAAYHTLSSQSKQRLARTLRDQGLDLYAGAHEENPKVLGAIVKIKLPGLARSRWSNPALVELALLLAPIWVSWTGRSIWPANVATRKASKFADWLEGLLRAANAPNGTRLLTNDMIHAIVRRPRRKK